ncbi:MAG: hypothetical protein GY757_22565 [bacterium]|nr:hypothetical protein [bacterium]
MKIIWGVAAAILLIPVLVFLAANIDTGPPPGEYTITDLPPANFHKNNGFYKIVTLAEPRDVGVENQEILDKYRDIFSRKSGDNYEDEDTEVWGDPQSVTYTETKEKDKALARATQFPDLFSRDLVKLLKSRKAVILKQKQENSYLLKRYEKLINSRIVEDFLSPALTIPYMRIMLIANRFYTAVKILEALEGDWTPAIQGLLTQLSFSRKLMKGSREIDSNFIGKAIQRNTLWALWSLMNLKECPKHVYPRVYEGMPELTFEDIRLGKTLIGAYLYLIDRINGDITMSGRELNKIYAYFCIQTNRTRKYFLETTNKLIKYDKIPLYKWEVTFRDLAPPRYRSGKFWWFRNAAGKTITDWMQFRIHYLIYRVYQNKAYYDLTRLAAQLHQETDTDKTAKEILSGLEAYKTIDLCSGKPYKWNRTQGLLYCVGMDGKDNNGHFKRRTAAGSDFSIPFRRGDKRVKRVK